MGREVAADGKKGGREGRGREAQRKQHACLPHSALKTLKTRLQFSNRPDFCFVTVTGRCLLPEILPGDAPFAAVLQENSGYSQGSDPPSGAENSPSDTRDSSYRQPSPHRSEGSLRGRVLAAGPRLGQAGPRQQHLHPHPPPARAAQRWHCVQRGGEGHPKSSPQALLPLVDGAQSLTCDITAMTCNSPQPLPPSS